MEFCRNRNVFVDGYCNEHALITTLPEDRVLGSDFQYTSEEC